MSHAQPITSTLNQSLMDRHCNESVPNATSSGFKSDQLKVTKRVQWDSKTISRLLQNQLQQTCDVTITKLPGTKPKKPINTHKRLTKLAQRYFPYEVEHHRTNPLGAHTKKQHNQYHASPNTEQDTDWVSIVDKAYSPTKPDIITIEEEDDHQPSTTSTDDQPIIMDDDFKADLCNLFGEISSSEED